ncbi:aspartate/glutamate racemase family protein [Streptomyces sp. CoT10]|uniref:aspartate/glutamate racemase family protein n=1 Tax=Streptomyces sp. CoT10 TaxID=2875762 RepID=UPI001CD7E537|nr:aspartate/glutamate racemase family protein [Streptomyces sp. CoT10]
MSQTDRVTSSESTLRDQVRDEIRSRISDGRYPAGARLVEQRLADEYGTSRIPVREALRMLESEGLVVTVPRRGVVVASLSRADLEHLYNLRESLEAMAFRLAAARATPGEVRSLHRLLERMRAAVEGGDHREVVAVNTQFHSQVVEMAGNPYLGTALQPVDGRLRVMIGINHDYGRQFAEHEALIKAISDGDADRAAALAAAHVDASRHSTLDRYDEHGPAPAPAPGPITTPADADLRLLVVNPNISTSVSNLIEAEARRAASPGTEIVMRTAESGVAYIETRLESLLAGPAVAELVAQAGTTADAVVVAAFGDPGLPALKELVDVPVVGITEAALATASLLGARMSIVAISERITPWYRDCVERNGLLGRLASIRSLRDPLHGIGTVQDDYGPELVRLANQVVTEDGADVVILAGAPLAGLAREVADQIPVPVVDGVAAGIAQAEALVRLAPGPARAGSYAGPPAKAHRGLSPALAAALEAAQNRD